MSQRHQPRHPGSGVPVACADGARRVASLKAGPAALPCPFMQTLNRRGLYQGQLNTTYIKEDAENRF